MARPPKEDWVPLMRQEAVKRLEAGRDVKVMDIAEVLGTSPALVHFYFGDRQHLVDEAWREILWAFVDQDSERVAEFAKERDWNGVGELVRDVLSEARDATHIAHVRAAGRAWRRMTCERRCERSTSRPSTAGGSCCGSRSPRGLRRRRSTSTRSPHCWSRSRSGSLR
jgi:Bacterial regulatory proteins, tetR family.